MGDELKNELGGIKDRLTRIETKLSERCDRGSERMDRLEDDVERLKLNQAKVASAAVALSAVLNYVLKGLGVQ